MPGLKRKAASSSDAGAAKHKAKMASEAKPQAAAAPPSSSLIDYSQTDFPRGGGSSLTPFEHASALKEARAEMSRAKRGDDDLFKDAGATASSSKRTLDADADEVKRREAKRKFNREKKNAKKKKIDLYKADNDEENSKRKGKEHIRIEHLNYKRLAPGTRLLCSVAAVHPLAIVLSLPNQLVGHVPITSISPLFTQKLHEAADRDSDDEGDAAEDDSDDESMDKALPSSSKPATTKLATGLPSLQDCFKAGQWVRAAVVAVKSADAARGPVSGSDSHEYDKESRRVELTLAPEAINDGVGRDDLTEGFLLPVAVKSKEDNGFLLDSGIEEVEGFLPFNKIDDRQVYVGQVFNVAVTSVTAQGRSFTASLKSSDVVAATLGPNSAPSISALVPGNQVSALVTAALPTGLNLKLWGMFDATLDTFHLPSPLPTGREMHEVYKVGSRVKARLLWESQKDDLGALVGQSGSADETGPRAIALSAAPHIMALSAPSSGSKDEALHISHPVGTVVEATVVRTDGEWGATCTVAKTNVRGFTHISRLSDEHVVKLTARAGPFSLGTTHKARVVGHAPTDRLLLLSFQQSVLEKSFMRVNEVEVGSVLKGTIKRVSPSGIFLNLGGAFEGVVFPLHFADVPLKKPEKKYKPGATVKARVLNVDPSRNRIALTLKKSLVSSEDPVISTLQDARVGLMTQATVSKFVDKRGLIVDLFGGLRAFVPTSEATEAPLGPTAPSLQSHFYEGKVVKVRLTHVDYEQNKLLASVKQASPAYSAKLDVSAVQVGDAVKAKVAAVHQDIVVLELQPSQIRALVSLKILAAQRNKGIDAVRDELEDGEELGDLVVTDKHPERGIVIVGDAAKPVRTARPGLAEPLNVGSNQTGRAAANPAEPNTVHVVLTGGCRGRLHLTDTADDYEKAGVPKDGESVQINILRLRNSGRRADVSLRRSRLSKGESSAPISDPEVQTAGDVAVGDKRRGFVKAVANAGLFVDLGRSVTARVLISELFDDYVKDWQSRFTVGQLVSGTVTAVNESQSKVEFSLRTNPGASKKSKADKAAERAAAKQAEKESREAGKFKFGDLKKGLKVNGFVRAVQDYGVFVQIENTDISGLAHKSQLTDNTSGTVLDPTKAFSVGDRVKAIVLEVHPEKKKVNFGLKPSYFTEEDFEEDAESSDEEEEDADDDDEDEEMDGSESGDLEAESDVDSDDIEMDTDALLNGDDDSDDDDLLVLESGEEDDEEEDDDSEEEEEDNDDGDDDDDDDSEEEDKTVAPKLIKPNGATALAPLELSGGFSWSVPDSANAADASDDEAGSGSDSDSDGDDDLDSSERATKTKGKDRRRLIDEDQTGKLATRAPESASDFERLLLSSPNSSYLWIQFMSFQLQLSQVSSARDIARRALRVINYREEEEKQNVWVALLNLENSYGTEEALDETFKEAIQYNDGETMHSKMATILEKTSKVDKAAEIWKRTVKRYSQSPSTWIDFAHFYLRNGRADDARALLPRSLQSLEKRHHVQIMSAFALAEFKHSGATVGGDAERGRTIFEGLIDRYPKRLDLWWQYIDQETSLSNISAARDLFQRCLNGQNWSSKKVKSLLKKWLDVEKKIGDEKGQQQVLARARKFVEELGQKKRRDAGEVSEDEDHGEGEEEDDEDDEEEEEE